jgi:hypothetical protein
MQDISALVGMLAVLEGEIRATPDGLPEWAHRLGERLTKEGLLRPVPSPEELWTAVGNLNQRLRYVLGEYDDEAEGQAF